jgi:hypothetical protein
MIYIQNIILSRRHEDTECFTQRSKLITRVNLFFIRASPKFSRYPNLFPSPCLCVSVRELSGQVPGGLPVRNRAIIRVVGFPTPPVVVQFVFEQVVVQLDPEARL